MKKIGAIIVLVLMAGVFIYGVHNKLNEALTGSAVSSSNFVIVSENKFYLNEQEWRPFGVTYFPSYTDVSLPNLENFWLHPSSYNSAKIEIELADIKNMGFNSIYAFLPVYGVLNPSIYCDNINNFLDTAKKNNLKVALLNPSCDPINAVFNNIAYGGNPLNEPDYSLCTSFIKACNLTDNTNIYAYILSAEPRVYGYSTNSNSFNPFFTSWLKERYGSLSNAQTNLGYIFSYDSKGYVKVPTLNELDSEDISKIKFVSAFRRFFDDWISKQYSIAVSEIRKVDKNHLISADSGVLAIAIAKERTGFSSLDFYPVNARATISAFDFIGIETYGDNNNKYAGFLTQYFSFGNKKPIVFTEYGIDENSFGEEAQASYYKSFFDAVIESNVQGSIAWWYITHGRARTGEYNSDYGIVKYSPIYSEKKVVAIIKQYALTMKSGQIMRTPNSWIAVDSDSKANLLSVLVPAAKIYRTNLALGYKSAVITPCTNTDSVKPYDSNWPFYESSIKCVGNANFDYNCPLKCLNSQFDYIKIKNSSGNWQEIYDNMVVYVAKNSPIYLKAKILNMGEGKWLRKIDSRKKGYVKLLDERENLDFKIKLDSNIEFLDEWTISSTEISQGITKNTKVDFAVGSSGIAVFGERIQNVKFIPIEVNIIQICNNNDTCDEGENKESCNDCECNTNSNCNDDNVCTLDNCSYGKCIFSNKNNTCNDNNACTLNDICSNGICAGEPKICSDNRDCSINDGCVNGECQFNISNCACSNNASCEDGNLCTNNFCNLTAGVCEFLYNTNKCNDSLPNTFNDKCSNGVCTGIIFDADNENDDGEENEDTDLNNEDFETDSPSEDTDSNLDETEAINLSQTKHTNRFVSFFIKLWCRIIHLFSKEKYLTCVNSNIS